MLRTGLAVVCLIGLHACGPDGPAERLLGDWEQAANDPMRQALERSKIPIPLPEQRTIFRFQADNVSVVEHWMAGKLVKADTNWYRLSHDGTVLETLPPATADTLRIQVRQLDRDTLELGLAEQPGPWMILVRK